MFHARGTPLLRLLPRLENPLRLLLLVSTFGCALVPISAAGQSTPTQTVIDGSKTPHLFPEWFVWEQAFLGLHEAISDRGDLRFPEAATQLLSGEIKTFYQSRTLLGDQIRETRKTLSAANKSEDEIRDRIQLHELDYRLKILSARQRLLEKLPADNLSALRVWIDRQLRGTKLYLRGRALQFFYVPG